MSSYGMTITGPALQKKDLSQLPLGRIFFTNFVYVLKTSPLIPQ